MPLTSRKLIRELNKRINFVAQMYAHRLSAWGPDHTFTEAARFELFRLTNLKRSYEIAKEDMANALTDIKAELHY